MKETQEWIKVCDAEDIKEEDVIRFDYKGPRYAKLLKPFLFALMQAMSLYSYKTLQLCD